LSEFKTLADRCLLAKSCTFANTASCTKLCPHYNALFGSSGKAGRSGNANLPEEYRLLTLETSPVRDKQTKIYDVLTKYIKTFTRQFDGSDERIKSLYLVSENPGTGKTTTAACIMNAYLTTHYIGSLQRGLTPDNRPIYFLDATQFQTWYNEFNRPKVPDHIAEPAAEKYYRAIEYAKQAQYVVIDDIGVRETVTEAFRSDLHSIINHRVTNRLPTCYTSNLPMSELPRVFGEQRLYDRIRDQAIEMKFIGESGRGIRK
jgi:DNA replication protein DnaC